MSAGPMDESFLWQADRMRVSVHVFEDVYIAFNSLSGDTHVLNFLSASLLDHLFAEPLPIPKLAETVRSSLEIDQDDCPDSLILSTLKELDETGLIEPVVSQGFIA